jgi:antimicrobial peptide system SdpB family protein
MMIEGGDQLTANLALLLIPITLTDDRTWHWEDRTTVEATVWRETSKRMIAFSTWIVIRVQVALVYLHSSIAKMGVEEWANGTALYYWLINPFTGATGWRKTIITPLLTNDVTVTFLTWGVIVYELFLFTALVMDRKWWPLMLYSALAFHAGIALFHGLVSFSIAMFGALILYVRPLDSHFELRFPHFEPLRLVTRAFSTSREDRAKESAA